MKTTSKINTITIAALAGFFASCTQSTQQGNRGFKQAGQRPSPEALFQKRDSNQDGFISYDEFKLFPKKGGQRASTNSTPSEDMRRKHFAMIDSNSDQRISLAEMKARPQRPSRAGR